MSQRIGPAWWVALLLCLDCRTSTPKNEPEVTAPLAAVLAALSKTLRTCTGCHQTYKQQLVSSLPD